MLTAPVETTAVALAMTPTNDLITWAIAIAGILLATWLPIYLVRKADKKKVEDDKKEALKLANEKEVREAADKGRHDAQQEQVDKEIVALWENMTQHGSKIQSVEVTLAGITSKLESMDSSLKIILEAVKK